MPTDPLQLTLAVLEYTLVFAGAGLLLWLLLSPEQRHRWFRAYSLPPIPLSLSEFVLGGSLIFLTGLAFSVLAQFFLRSHLVRMQDQLGLQLLTYSLANYAGALVGWRVFFPYLLRSWQTGPGLPPSRPSRPTLTWSEATGYAVGTLLVALPVLILISLAWTKLLQVFGLPAEPQDLIALFAQTRSPWVVAGMLLVACGLAPVYEELLFRAGLYRFIRHKLGRGSAMLISSVCFGALHANWAGFLPLAVLGCLLALVYEATGSLRVAIIAHGLFNLNTIILVLAGLNEAHP